MGGAAKGGCRSAAAVGFCWLLIPLLTPFLAGGVVVGDEGLLLTAIQGLDASSLSFADFARSPDGWYVVHHILWFGLLYLTAHVVSLLHFSPLMTEVIISSQSVVAALASIALCFTFLVRRLAMTPVRAAWITLAFFAAGYGLFSFCMAGTIESYMMLAFAGRLFFVERPLTRRGAVWLALLDFSLVAMKPYSLLFLVATWPLLKAAPGERKRYFCFFLSLLVLLGATKLWLWNPAYNAAVNTWDIPSSLSRFAQEFFSPWTGLLFCLPVLWLLVWHDPVHRRSILYKTLGLCGCAAVFSLYDFFNGGIAGGRYIFPFVVALLPEIAVAGSRLFDRRPLAAWVLIPALVVFMPVAWFGYPYFPANTIPSLGPCAPDHPAVYSWKITAAKMTGRPLVEICFEKQRYVLDPRDAASPRLAPWRVAYMLNGGHSEEYRELTHNDSQQRHDAWGSHIAERLSRVGLGRPEIWTILGLLPFIAGIWLSFMAAIGINRAKHPS